MIAKKDPIVVRIRDD